jgi:catechol-2,3-dioxygenase
MTRIKSCRLKQLAAEAVLTLLSVGSPLLAMAQVSADNPLQLATDHVSLSVADIDKEAAWYEDVLGFKEYKRGGEGTNTLDSHLRIPGVYRIDLFQQKGSARHTTPGSGFQEQGYTHIVFKTALSLDTVNQQLLAKNATVVADKDKNGSVTNILVRDPEGNEIEIQH